MQVAIVTVGDEILAGDTENTNATWLCRQLDDRGVDLRRVTTLPDDVADIAQVVNEYYAAFDAVIVTGGLGPTHDDRTLEGVAAAFGREMEPSDEARSWLDARDGYSADELTDGTIHLPAGARMLRNEVGVAPGAVVESVYVLPGVPEEMKRMFDLVANEFSGETTHTARVVVDEPESHLIDRLETLRTEFDVTVGSYPGETVRIKLSASDEETVERAAAWLRDRVTSPS